MNAFRAITTATLFALTLFMLPTATAAADVQVCCTCKLSPCNASQSTVAGADQAAAEAACRRACGTVPGIPSCVESSPLGACTEEIGIRGGGPVIGFTNPICRPGKTCTPPIIIGNIIRAILGIVGSIALLMFIIGGFTWMLAQGNTEKTKQAREIMVWAGLGLLVIFAAYAIINFIITAATS